MRSDDTAIGKCSCARILIVDDNALVRRSLRDLIECEADLSVCGEADTAAEALALIASLKPDLAIVDIGLKTTSGLDLVAEVRARGIGVGLLIVSVHCDPYFAQRALVCGAGGYVVKRDAPDAIVEAIRRVLAGGVYVSETMAARLSPWR